MNDTQQLPAYKEMASEILSDAHAIHCAAEVGMPCDCRVPGAIAAMRAENERLQRELADARADLEHREKYWEQFDHYPKGADDEPSAVPSGDGFESALITIWENLSTIRPDDFKQPDGEAETQVCRAYCAAENALLEVGRLRREGHSVELVPTKGESQ